MQQNVRRIRSLPGVVTLQLGMARLCLRWILSRYRPMLQGKLCGSEVLLAGKNQF